MSQPGSGVRAVVFVRLGCRYCRQLEEWMAGWSREEARGVVCVCKGRPEDTAVLAGRSGGRYPVLQDTLGVVSALFGVTMVPSVCGLDSMGRVTAAEQGLTLSKQLLAAARQR